MKVKMEVDDDTVVSILRNEAHNSIWHINSTIKSLRHNYNDDDKTDFLLEDLYHFFNNLKNSNDLIINYGEKPILPFSANVEPGFDLDGKPLE